ncbi:MAG: hypothetical protein BGP06_13045 [Rhizobiales bacterium 65-9]|nr:hypothetical protein [Hyphomicrobiales bacterium]OJY39333.1 MAG: hypothetical protein BGP06_13045 [Rhizobiales bacterium 65-9]
MMDFFFSIMSGFFLKLIFFNIIVCILAALLGFQVGLYLGLSTMALIIVGGVARITSDIWTKRR